MRYFRKNSILSGKCIYLPSIICIIAFIWTICNWLHPLLTNAETTLVIALDPGHGSVGSGCSTDYDDTIADEATLNLKIAKYLKEELESYDDVELILTRDSDYDVELEERTMIGVDTGADVLISLHNNSYGEDFEYDHGCTVLVSRGQYKKELAQKEQELGVSILHELSELGLEDQGLLLRDSTDGETYPNGKTADYYAIIRNGIKNDLMSILIEHAFVDNESDYKHYLSSDEKLKKLAQADARGIARYFGLQKKDSGERVEPLSNISEKLLYMKDKDPSHDVILEQTFFKKTTQTDLAETTTETDYDNSSETTTETAAGKPGETTTETAAEISTSEQNTATQETQISLAKSINTIIDHLGVRLLLAVAVLLIVIILIIWLIFIRYF